jgi:Trp operon repressor
MSDGTDRKVRSDGLLIPSNNMPFARIMRGVNCIIGMPEEIHQWLNHFVLG